MERSVLVVEDDTRFSREFAAAVGAADDLRLAGVARNVAEGLAALDALRPDVLLADIGLPDGSGLTVIRYAADKHPACEIMVISVFHDDTTIFKSLCAGATGYLLKDERALDIAHQIRRLCEGGSPVSPSIARRLVNVLSGRHGSGKSDDGDNGGKAEDPAVLSAKETSVLLFSAKGYTSDEIARMMDISYHTVETYIRRIYRKLHVHSKTAAIFEARSLGLIDQ